MCKQYTVQLELSFIEVITTKQHHIKRSYSELRAHVSGMCNASCSQYCMFMLGELSAPVYAGSAK